jgi:hypothetical protein
MKRLLNTICVVVALSAGCLAQSTQAPEGLKQYAPVLPSVREKFWQIDPNLGYAMKDVGGGVYGVSDNGWQSAFLVTDAGVIVFDAPETFGAKVPSAVASVTKQPIKYLVYSHIHRDHIGGAAAFRKVNGLKIVAMQSVSDFLKTQNNPERPVPDETFISQRTIKLGNKTVQLSRHFYHSNEGDLFIFVPEAKFMMAVDCVTPGYIPFSGFDITTNFSIGNKHDVEETKEFTMDVYQTVKRIHNNMNQKAVVDAKTIGYDNEFLLFRVVLDKVTDQAVAELRPRWINRLAGVDVWLETQVRCALVYVRWDDKL